MFQEIETRPVAQQKDNQKMTCCLTCSSAAVKSAKGGTNNFIS